MLQKEAIQHLEKYWRLSSRFFEESDYALSAFFAITLIEEVGKIIILGNEELGAELDKKGFYSHCKKYAYAVYTTLLVNSRVSRNYGVEESRFAKWFREEELFSIRNRALYLELTNSGIGIPSQSVPRDDAFLLVCIAGEVYAEIQGHYVNTDSTEWGRIVNEVDAFRKKNRI